MAAMIPSIEGDHGRWLAGVVGPAVVVVARGSLEASRTAAKPSLYPGGGGVDRDEPATVRP